MNPLKHKLANEWMRQDDASPQEALDTWNTMEAEFKLNRAALQEPRTMTQEPRMGLKPGGIVEPGVEYYGKFTEAEKKANVKTWMDNTGSTLKDYNELPEAPRNNIKYGKITGIKQTPEFGKKLEGAATKKFRNWLSKQDPKTLTADSVEDLIKQSKIKITSQTRSGTRPGLVHAISRIMEEKEFAKFKNIQLGRTYPSEQLDEFADAILDAYAKDDITKIVDPKYKSNITRAKINKYDNLDNLVKKTGLDEETIFNLFDDREAYIELDLSEEFRTGRPVEKGKAKFYKQAENWIVKNSKRYADPDKFKKAFIRTFGKDNDLIQKINRSNKRMSTSVPFSDWFRTNIMGSSEQAMKGQVKPGYSAKQLDHIFKTAIYTNNENVRNKIIKELTDILPEKGSKRIPDIREKFRNSPILKKFGLNQRIEGPIARLLAKEVGDGLLKQVSLFRKPWLGTTELLTYLKDRVDPKYKSMFEETSKAVLYAQKNQWPEAKKALNISESIMFDHKIPKALMQLGYADDIEYIKVTPTSAEFNARIKNTQFDKPMIKLANQWEKAKTVDAKSKIVGDMNTLKDNFSKKYGNYLDDVKINVDKTGKPIFSSKTPVVTKQTDLVKSLETSLQHEKFPTMSKAKKVKFLNSFSKTFQDLSPQSVLQMGRTHGCLKKNEGGSIMRCLQTKFNEAPEKFLQRSAPLAKGNPNLFKWFKNGRKIARGAGVFLAWEAAFAPIIAGWSALEGETGARMINEIAYGIPFIGETEKEEWKREAGGDESAYAMKRLSEIQDQELPYLKQQRDAVINKMAHVPGKSPRQNWIEKDIEEKELELQETWNKSGFMEGPAASYLNEDKAVDAFNLSQQTTEKIAADKAERKKERFDALRKAGIIADRNWQSQVPKAEGGIMNLKKK